MFSLLESKEEIAKAQRNLEATIRREFKNRVVKNIGYPGGTTHNAKVQTNGQYWFWSEDHDRTDEPNPRRLNWFGLFIRDADLQISVEINTPYEGQNGQVAGFFARDNDTGTVYLLHSGRVGGGMKGVGKSAFLAWSSEPLTKVLDSSEGIRQGVLVLPVEGKAATKSAVRYINKIADFKRAVRVGELETPEFRHIRKEFDNFYSESRGRRTGRRSSKIDYLSRHGEVVDALEAWRKSRPLTDGARSVKSVLMDLGYARGRKLIELYEVKTSTTRSDVYCAIGQLMVHGKTDECRRFMVLPYEQPVAADLADALQRLQIEVLKFKLSEVDARIV